MKDYSKILNLLNLLKINADQIISLIENSSPDWEVTDAIHDDISLLSEQILATVLGDCPTVINSNCDDVHQIVVPDKRSEHFIKNYDVTSKSDVFNKNITS